MSDDERPASGVPAGTGSPAALPPRPVLTDGVVLLREPVAHDTEAMVAGAGQASVAATTRVPSPYTHDDAADFLERTRVGWQESTAATFALCRAGRPDLLLGMVGLHDVDLSGEPGGAAEMGYWLAEEARGRGLMTRGVRLLCAWAFDDLRLARIDWFAKVGNDASRRVAEAVGVEVEGILRRGQVLRGQRVDHWVGGLLPADLVREQQR